MPVKQRRIRLPGPKPSLRNTLQAVADASRRRREYPLHNISVNFDGQDVLLLNAILILQDRGIANPTAKELAAASGIEDESYIRAQIDGLLRRTLIGNATVRYDD